VGVLFLDRGSQREHLALFQFSLRSVNLLGTLLRQVRGYEPHSSALSRH